MENMVIFTIISYILLALIAVITLSISFANIQYVIYFHFRPCKHCGHYMNYHGLKIDDKDGHYLFYCPKCGAWEQVPKEQFYKCIISE